MNVADFASGKAISADTRLNSAEDIETPASHTSDEVLPAWENAWIDIGGEG